jgi:hypothetical protein
VFSWTDLRVTRISGRSGPGERKGTGGFNLYLQDRSGRQFFLTHVENVRVRQGQIVKAGQQLAAVGNYPGMDNHVHIGYQGGDPDTTLGLKAQYIFSAQGASSGSQAITQNITRLTKSLTPEQLRNVGQAILHGDLKPGDLPPGSEVHGTGGTIPGTNTTLRDAAGVIKSPWEALQWVSGNWDRVAEVAGGFILVLVGLLLLGKSVGLSPKGPMGDLANRYNFGPNVSQASHEDLHTGTSHDVSGRSDTLPRRSAQGATTASGDDIPY